MCVGRACVFFPLRVLCAHSSCAHISFCIWLRVAYERWLQALIVDTLRRASTWDELRAGRTAKRCDADSLSLQKGQDWVVSLQRRLFLLCQTLWQCFGRFFYWPVLVIGDSLWRLALRHQTNRAIGPQQDMALTSQPFWSPSNPRGLAPDVERVVGTFLSILCIWWPFLLLASCFEATRFECKFHLYGFGRALRTRRWLL